MKYCDRGRAVIKGIFTVVFTSIFLLIFCPTGNASAYSEARTKTESLKLDKTSKKLALSKSIDTLIYEFEVEKAGFFKATLSSGKLTDDVDVKLTYKYIESSALLTETVSPKKGKLKTTVKTGGLLIPGKYYLIVNSKNSDTVSDKISVKVTVDTIKISDNDNNNTFAAAQYYAFEGTERYYRMAKLRPYGMDEDMIDWVYFKCTDGGAYIEINTFNDFMGQFRMEIYKYDDSSSSDPELKYGYEIKDNLTVTLVDLPAGTYYLKFRWNEYDTDERSFEGMQVIYGIKAAPYKRFDEAGISPSTVTLGMKGAAAAKELKINTKPEGGTITSAEWKSSNKKVVTVDEKGNLKAVGTGTATITCEVKGIKSDSAKCTCKVTVKEQEVKLNKTSLTLKKGDKAKLEADVSPKESVTWHSDNEAVASVSKKGVVKAVSNGTAKIYAKSKSGVKSNVCVVSVKSTSSSTPAVNPGKAVSSEISIKASLDTIDMGFKTKVTLFVGDKGGTWSVSDELELVSADDEGATVRGKKAGKGTVTYSVGGKKKSITINVE